MKKTEENLPEVHKAELLPERDLDSEISQTLVRANVTDAVIAELKNKYGGMKLKSIDDKEGYLDIVEARKQTRKIGIMAEKICKAGREDAVAIQKKWLGKEKEVLGNINEVQEPLDVEIKKFEDNVAEQEAAERKRQEEQFMSRQTTLLKMEAKFSDGSFTLGNVSYELNNIKEADEEIWNDVILNKFKKEFEKVETARAEEEKKKQESADELARQQEELRKQQEQFEEQKRQMAEQQRLLDEQKRQQEDAIRQEQQRKDKDESDRKSALQTQRFNELFPFNPTGADVEMMSLWSLSDEDYDKILSDKKIEFEKKQKEADELKLQQIKEAEQRAIQNEKDRQAEQARLDEIKRQQEQQKQAEESAAASEKEKWSSFLSLLNAVSLPDFKSGKYRAKLNIAKEKLSEISEL